MGTSEKTSKYVIGSNRGQLLEDSAKAVAGANGSSVEHIEVAKGQRSRRDRVAAHYRRWWLCHLLGVIIFLAIFLPVFFLVAFPAIVQRMVDDTGLPVHAGKLMNPTPDSLEYSISASLKVPAPFTVRLDPLTLHLYRTQQTPEQAYVGIPFPRLELKGNSTVEVVDATVPILHKADFTKFLSEVARQRTFVLAAEGTTTAHLGRLKAKLKLDKKLELNGLDMFRGFNIESARVILPFQKDGTNLKVVLNIPNHSIIALQLGNVTLDLFSGDILLGQVVVYDVVLKPGNNTVNGDCRIDIKSAIANLVPILEGQRKALSEGNLELTANGNSTIYNGKHITYFEDVLNNINLKASLSIIKVLIDTLRGLTEGGKGLGGILELLKGDGFDDIMGVLREALKGDGLKNIINGLGTILKEVVGVEGASLNDSLGGSNLEDVLGGLKIKDVVGELKKLDLKELGLDEILTELKNSQS
ncbi:hypothetical protein EMPG_10586 [Blastomyces silverae]|uniref:Uncharacterized protein n=1 Tax=Blastomyces silverae TaxID=2060906 RepID=A0A0H1B4H3_9EURO|nr:hypothetical protein EMPG_10586 [Blastomyces silverae]